MTFFIGLDMGTSSVGYAVSNEQYEILNFRQKAMWGVRLFDEAKTAADRRTARTSRRRLARRNLRLKLLQDLFAEAINAVDPGFYQRLKDSFFYPEDKDEEQIYSLFADADFTDKDYHKKYPTIYHLRHALISNTEPHDPRLVYLAIHHILKSRGHFLFTGSFDMQGNGQYIETFKDFQATLSEVFELTLPSELAEPIKNAINDKSLKKREKTEELKKITNWKDVNAVAILELLSNRKVRISKLFGDEYKDQSPKDVTFEGTGFEEEKQAELQALLSDDEFSLLLSTYRLHNQLRLDTLLQGYETYSASKIGLYEKHGADLRKLKRIFRKYFSSDDYKAFFSQSKSKLNNYVAYTGHLKKNKKKVAVNYRCDAINFLDDLRKKLEPVARDNPEDTLLAEVLVEIDNQLFLPKQVSKDNSLIPNQIHVEELKAILNNASAYLPFLNEIGEDNHTIKEMIIKLAEFRIPYYVGPLNPAHKVRPEKKDGSHHAWITKRSDEAVRPWNFHRVVDEEQSANDFIANLTNKCTYLIGEDVLPKESPSYARFILLNQLNMLSYRGERLSVIYKHAIYEELFMAASAKPRFSKKDIAEFLNIKFGDDFNAADIGGMDLHINNVLKAERQIEAIAPNQLSLQDKEDIVRLITVLPDSNKMLVNRLKDQFHAKLNDEQIKRISQLSFKDWGNLSEKLLSGIRAIGPDGVETNILDAMWNNNLTLMELLSASYGFKEQIDAYNNEIVGEARTLDYQIVDEYPYLSPAVKRMIWQAIKIVNEIVKIQKGAPEKIFIEVAREEGKKERTTSRLEQLKQIYKEAKILDEHLLSELNEQSESSMRRKKIYLYFTQLGKCAYTGKPIDFEKLLEQGDSSDAYYDIDHIYPRSKTKDDSLRNNLVLVESSANRDKGDKYPISLDVQNARRAFWFHQKEKGLISDEKFFRLNRTTELSDEELESFISRQLVQTRQATKAAAEILGKFYPDTRVVFVKAGHVSDFRYNQRDFEFIKVRAMNDLHHAKDAYLNIVVGNVFDTKFTQDVRNYIKTAGKRDYNLARMYDFDVKSRDGKSAWKAGQDGTIQMVSKMMARNNIVTSYQAVLRTRGQSGGLFDQNLLPKGQGQYPIKSTDPRFVGDDGIAKYGGYKNITGATYFVVEHTLRNKRVRSILPLYLPWILTNEQTEENLQNYCLNTLNLLEPRIILNDLPFKSVLRLNGFPFQLLGRSDNRLQIAPALQPFFPAEIEPIIKTFTKDIEDDVDDKVLLRTVTEEDLLLVYRVFQKKLSNAPYNKHSNFNNQANNLKNSEENFVLLSVREKFRVLNQILILFTCDGRLSDLSLLLPKDKNGKPSTKNTQVGMIRIPQNIQEGNQLEVVFQSVTGLYEKTIRISLP